MVIFTDTALQNVSFKACKIVGVNFENCNPFGFEISFENCELNFSIFYKTSIKKTHFKNSRLQEVDFSACDLTYSIFDNCDLTRATFIKSILEHVDFRTAYNFVIDPELNRIKNAKFSTTNCIGLLAKYKIRIT